MEKTQVKAYLKIVGNDFIHENITNIIGVLPEKAWTKGELFKGNLIRNFSHWSYGTNYEESLDIMEQIRYVVDQFYDKVDVLKELKSNFDLEFYISVVIQIYNNQVPGIVIDKEAVRFAYSIGAEFDIDTYIY